MKTFLLRSVPFVLSILCGVALFFASVYGAMNEDWATLLNGIAASLLAIPIIFLVYNYADYKMSARVNKSLATSLTFEINAFMLKLIMVLRRALGVRDRLTWKSIQRMLNTDAPTIKKRIKIGKNDLPMLKTYKEDLNDLVFRVAKTAVLDGGQIQTLASMTSELSRLINEREFRGNTAMMAKYMEKLLEFMDDWFESCEREALVQHQHFQLAIDTDQ